MPPAGWVWKPSPATRQATYWMRKLSRYLDRWNKTPTRSDFRASTTITKQGCTTTAIGTMIPGLGGLSVKIRSAMRVGRIFTNMRRILQGGLNR